jgi:hypothetical protein
MYGLFLSIVLIITIGIVKMTYDYTANTDGPSATMSMPDTLEAEANSIAGAIQLAMADVAQSCIEQSPNNTANACSTGADSANIKPNGWGTVTTFPIYGGGVPLGSVDTYYIKSKNGLTYLTSTWVPANQNIANQLCGTVGGDLTRMTRNSLWIGMYNTEQDSIGIYQTDTNGINRPVNEISLPAPAGSFYNGCPAIVEPDDN